jgi:hypothetical protein
LKAYCARSFDFGLHFDFFKELFGHGNQCVLRPFEKPINCATINQTREHSDSVSKGVSNRGESEHNMKISFASFNKEGIKLIRSSFCGLSISSSVCSDEFHEVCLFIRGKKVGNLASVKQIVNVFNESFLFDLTVCEKEDCRLVFSACGTQNLFNIVVPFDFAISFADFYLENVKINHC